MSTNNRKSPLLSAAACSLSASVANGAIQTSVVDISLPTVDSANVYIDVETNAFSTSSFGGQDIQVTFRSGNSSNQAKAEVTASNDFAIHLSNNTVSRFGFGDTLSGEGSGLFVTETSSGNGNWGGFTGIAFLGLEKSGNRGWIELDYQAEDQGGFITVKSFAYGTEGEITQAGVIPEPAHTAALCALLAGSAVAFSRRRKTA